jgi:hypothetical protein
MERDRKPSEGSAVRCGGPAKKSQERTDARTGVGNPNARNAGLEKGRTCDVTVTDVTRLIRTTLEIPEAAAKHPRKEYPDKHRGRDTLGEIRDKNRDKLFNAPSSGAFWKEIKRLADPKPDPIMVTADSLRDVFEKRLNPPAVMPTAFDEIRHKVNQTLAAMIPDTTQDTTQEKFSSSEWVEDDGA